MTSSRLQQKETKVVYENSYSVRFMSLV